MTHTVCTGTLKVIPVLCCPWEGKSVNVSRKHKLNVGKPTKHELVSIAYVLGVMMWCKYFMEAQGYTVDNNLLYHL